METKRQYVLSLSEAQMDVMSEALDLYSRLFHGQLQSEIIHKVYDRNPSAEHDQSSLEGLNTADIVDNVLLKLRCLYRTEREEATEEPQHRRRRRVFQDVLSAIEPLITNMPACAKPGIGSKLIHDNARTACDLNEVLRHRLWHDRNEGAPTLGGVDKFPPFHWNKAQPLATVVQVQTPTLANVLAMADRVVHYAQKHIVGVGEEESTTWIVPYNCLYDLATALKEHDASLPDVAPKES